MPFVIIYGIEKKVIESESKGINFISGKTDDLGKELPRVSVSSVIQDSRT